MPNLQKQLKLKYHIIYQITNTINQKIYIGAHSTDNLDDGYMGSGKVINRAINKHGVSCFQKVILHMFDNPFDMFDKEKDIVNEDFIQRPDVYNMVTGGFGGHNKGTFGLKHMHHPISGKRIAVPEEEIADMEKQGWRQGRLISSTTNTKWIHRESEKKMVHIEELQTYLNMGWIKGLPKSPTHGKCWIYYPLTGEYSMCNSSDINQKLSEGWIKQKWSPHQKGATCFVHNQESCKVINLNEKDYWINLGWKPGRPPLKPHVASKPIAM